jgi:hypothetical protein
VQDSTGATVTSTYSLTVNPAVSLGSLSVTQWRVNQPGYNGKITVSGGTPAYSGLSVTGLPPGLTASLSGGTISFTGTPTQRGTFTVQVTVQDSTGATVTKTYTLKITR